MTLNFCVYVSLGTYVKVFPELIPRSGITGVQGPSSLYLSSDDTSILPAMCNSLYLYSLAKCLGIFKLKIFANLQGIKLYLILLEIALKLNIFS